MIIILAAALLGNSEPEWPWRDMDDPSGRNYCVTGKVEVLVGNAIECLPIYEFDRLKAK